MDPIIIISVIGTVASLVSLLISSPDLKSKIIHITYAIVLTIVAGGSIILANNIANEKEELNIKLKAYEELSANAERIINSRSSYVDVGGNRGFILTSFAFLEKHKIIFPETYMIANDFIVNGVLIKESAPSENLEKNGTRKKECKMEQTPWRHY